MRFLDTFSVKPSHLIIGFIVGRMSVLNFPPCRSLPKPREVIPSNLKSDEGTPGMNHNKCCTNNCLLSHDIELEPATII